MTQTVPSGQASGPPNPTPAVEAVPVSGRNLLDCLNSTRYWTKVLPEYANDMQRRADNWAIASGVLSALTGLGVWATLSKDARTWAQIVVAVVALAGGICALIPRVKNYGEMAGQARQLQSAYGRLEGLLLDAELDRPHAHDDKVRALIIEFDTTKSSKDTNLRDMPGRPAAPTGLVTDERGIQTWPPDTYWKARAQQRRMRRPGTYSA